MTDSNPKAEIMQAVRDHKDRFRTAGIAMIVIGALAILFPLFFSVLAKTMVGVLFLLTGAALMHHAFHAKSWESAIPSGVIAVLHLFIGVYLAFFPMNGLIGLTFLIGLVFLLQGAIEGYIATQHRPEKGWGWLAFNGAATLLLGVFLIAGLPGTALWAIGLFLGINFLSTGISFVALARSV